MRLCLGLILNQSKRSLSKSINKCSSFSASHNFCSAVSFNLLIPNDVLKFTSCSFCVQACKAHRPTPDYIRARLEHWATLKKKSDEELAQKPRQPLKIQLLDGRIIDGSSWQTTPFDVAETLGKNIIDSAIVAKVDNELWDLDRPLESDCRLQLLKFDDPEGQQVFWHSTAHVLGEALENIYGGLLCYGPPTANGFYYDLYNDVEPVGHSAAQNIFHF